MVHSRGAANSDNLWLLLLLLLLMLPALAVVQPSVAEAHARANLPRLMVIDISAQSFEQQAIAEAVAEEGAFVAPAAEEEADQLTACHTDDAPHFHCNAPSAPASYVDAGTGAVLLCPGHGAGASGMGPAPASANWTITACLVRHMLILQLIC